VTRIHGAQQLRCDLADQVSQIIRKLNALPPDIFVKQLRAFCRVSDCLKRLSLYHITLSEQKRR
jgi:hypothetical protein